MHGFLDRLRFALADRYAIEREIGRGGMAVVYLARDLKHDRAVALKVLHPELGESLGAERFLREIDIAAKLSHAHIVPVYDSGQAAGVVYFTMPYVEGRSLRDRLVADGRIPLDETLRIAREVAMALTYAHAHDVVHRDIKPENILLAGGVAVVVDFGIARAISAAGGKGLTSSGFPLGTLGYMSPEQAAGGHALDGRSDVYSLGCVIYEMLVGRPPQRWLDLDTLEHGRVTDAAPEERLHLDSLPHPVERLLVRALAQSPGSRFQTADEFLAALEATAAGGSVAVPAAAAGDRAAPASPGRWRRRPAAWSIAALVLAVVGVLVARSRRPSDLDPNRIAVAPFDVLGSQLDTWREGLVDLLAASLDGAGPLHAVPPSVVIRHWEGRADAVTAPALGREFGAGLVLYGRLIQSGTDSARALATLIDVETGRSLMEFDLRDRADRVDRLADSLAVQLMTGLSRTRGLSGWRLASLGSSSPTAIKAFLQGEQHYRAFNLDSAEFYYRRAIDLDSGFALAYSRRANAVGWSLDYGFDYAPSLLRAGALNRGLARRESLLVAADSIDGALVEFLGGTGDWELLRRLFATLELAAALYAADPQVWYELGEARYHYGPVLGMTDAQAAEAFERAVELDSAFVPAYRHQIELALLAGEPEAAARVAAEYVARSDSSLYRDAEAVTAALLDAERAAADRTDAALGALPLDAFYQVWYDLKWWIDSAETSARVARAWHASYPGDASRQSLALALTYRGHLADARDLVGENDPALYAVLARFGAIPADSASAQFAAWLRDRNVAGIQNGHRWWADLSDTVSLAEAGRIWDSVAAATPPDRAHRARDVARSSRGYLALARGDTAGALAHFDAIPVWPNRYFNYYERMTRAQLLARQGRDREAAVLLDTMPFLRQYAPTADAIIVELERGRVHERLDNRAAAMRAYGQVVDAWERADPLLQPLVEEARGALGRLVAERRQ